MLNIRKGGHKDFEHYYPLMEIDFDSEELISKLAVHKGMLNGAIDFLVVSDDESGMDAAYALMLKGGMYGYTDMKYMAVMPWFRSKGVGIETMRLIHKYYADSKGIIAELSEFEDPDPDRLKKLRRFFGRFGYQEIKSNYTIRGTKVNLLVKPIKGTAEIAAVAHRIVPELYSRFLGNFSLPDYMEFHPLGVRSEE